MHLDQIAVGDQRLHFGVQVEGANYKQYHWTCHRVFPDLIQIQ